MNGLLSLLHLVLALGVLLTGAYVCYHIIRYSVSKESAIATASVFAGVLSLLLIANVVLFHRVDWNGLLTVRGVGAPVSSEY